MARHFCPNNPPSCIDSFSPLNPGLLSGCAGVADFAKAPPIPVALERLCGYAGRNLSLGLQIARVFVEEAYEDFP